MSKRLTFDDWLKAVDAIVTRKWGIDIDSGVDWPSYDTWDDGASAEEGAKEWKRCQDEW